jgi:hypothetical protein
MLIGVMAYLAATSEAWGSIVFEIIAGSLLLQFVLRPGIGEVEQDCED